MITAIIPAAGQGRRMQAGKNKAYLTILGQPILVRSALALSNSAEVDNLIVVVAEGEVQAAKQMLSAVPGLKPWEIVIGGSERQYSIANALRAVSPESTMILVHDAARPLIDSNDVSRLIAAVRIYKAAGIAVPVKDTIKVTDEDAFAIQTPRRNTLWSIQTPQGFEAKLLRDAYTKAMADNFCGTDDASLVERLGVRVKLVQGSYQNIKVTTPEDILVAEAFLQQGGISINKMPRVGMGYDVHAFQAGRKLILGGVEVPYEMGLLGHSDADVLLHAIKDALLGAAGLGDIGRHFPDTDPKYKGVSSLLLLERVREILSEYSYNVINIDATVVAQKPKLAAYIQQMNANIAQTLNMDIRQVNVKATTTEGLGFTGRKEGIAAYAVVSIVAGN